MFETVNQFMVKGRIGGIVRNNRYPSRFFINAYINRRDVSLLITSQKAIPANVKDGDYVLVSGHISVTPVEFRRAGERYRQRFQADSIDLSPSVMEDAFGTKGRYQTPDYFVALFKGTVTHASKNNDDWAKLTIMTDIGRLDRQPSRIALDYQTSQNRFNVLPEFDYKIGDNVQVVCSVTTSSSDKEDGKVFYQNLKVEDICKLTASGKVKEQAVENEEEELVEEEVVVEEE